MRIFILRHKNAFYELSSFKLNFFDILIIGESIMHFLISKSIDLLIHYKIISTSQISIYAFGLELFYLSVLELVSIFAISLYLNNFFETFLFFFAFCILRLYTGGLHAKTRLSCYLSSLILYIIFSYLPSLIPTNHWLFLIIFFSLFTIGTVFYLSPIVHKATSINTTDYLYCKKISRMIVVSDVFIIFIALLLHVPLIYIFSFALGIFTQSVSLIILQFQSYSDKKDLYNDEQTTH